ncbi:MAG: 50S ribosomal protein L25, partial [Candidatus Pacebacteria bacterium]|nr:50S ribosomal protein L25 [Candidatus Paceibacterota bacterium]
LKITERDNKIKLSSLRAEGSIPAVYYSSKEKTTSISIDKIDFKKVLKEVGETSVLELEGEKGKINVMIHDIQLDPVSSDIIHVDFYAIKKGQKVEVSVPLEFEGESPAEKLGAVLVKVLHEIEVEGEPQNIPQHFTIDIASLVDLDSQILVKDISVPKGVEIVTGGDEVVVAISEAKEEEPEEVAEVDMENIEVEQKGKKEEDGEGEPAETEKKEDKK